MHKHLKFKKKNKKCKFRYSYSLKLLKRFSIFKLADNVQPEVDQIKNKKYLSHIWKKILLQQLK